MSAGLTPWFTTPEAAPGRFNGRRGVNPVRIGVYIASTSKNKVYRHWDGKNWGPYGYTPEGAVEFARMRVKPGSIKHWRGLTEAEYVRLGGVL